VGAGAEGDQGAAEAHAGAVLMCPILRLCHAMARAAAHDNDPRAKQLHALALAALVERDRLHARVSELEKGRDERHDVMTDLA
jgi:hypothetical protein